MQIDEAKKSRGHLVFHDGYEYFQFVQSVFRVPIESHFEGDIRVDSSFYCTMNAWLQSPIMRS